MNDGRRPPGRSVLEEGQPSSPPPEEAEWRAFWGDGEFDRDQTVVQQSPWDRLTGVGGRRRPSTYTKVAIAIGIGLLLAVVPLVLQNTPVGGPTKSVQQLAAEVAPEPALRVDRSPETQLSSQSEVTNEPELNPNAIFVSSEGGSADSDGLDVERPLQSLQDALERVEPGWTIYLLTGRYDELSDPGNAHYIARRGGTSENWVTIEALPGHTPEIVTGAANGLEIQADYIEVSGLTVRGENYDTDSSPWGNGILIRNSHHVRVVGNTISNMPLNGVSTVESSNLAILNNEIFENAFWNASQGSGISLWHSKTDGEPPDADGYHDRVMGNRLYRNENRVKSKWKNYESITDGNGIIIDQGRETGYEGRVLVANNEVFDNGGRGIMVFETDRVDVIHNTVYHNGRTAELLGGPAELVAGSASDVRFFNNLVWPREGAEAIKASKANKIESGGNVIIGGGPPGFTSDSDTIFPGDPKLARPSVDEAEADFRPQPGSPAVGAGITLSTRLNWDRYGGDRRTAEPTSGAYLLAGTLE